MLRRRARGGIPGDSRQVFRAKKVIARRFLAYAQAWEFVHRTDTESSLAGRTRVTFLGYHGIVGSSDPLPQCDTFLQRYRLGLSRAGIAYMRGQIAFL